MSVPDNIADLEGGSIRTNVSRPSRSTVDRLDDFVSALEQFAPDVVTQPGGDTKAKKSDVRISLHSSFSCKTVTDMRSTMCLVFVGSRSRESRSQGRLERNCNAVEGIQRPKNPGLQGGY